MATRVVHVRKEPYDIYIGRACAEFSESDWANPFRLGDDGTRDQVIELYREYILRRKDLMVRLHELRGLTLGCWCKPSKCHGDVLAELANITDSHSIVNI